MPGLNRPRVPVAAGQGGFAREDRRPREIFEGERRVALTPQSALALKKLGYECLVESGAGVAAGFSDAAYAEAGVTVVPSAADLWSQADVVAKIRPPEVAEVDLAHRADPRSPSSTRRRTPSCWRR